MDAEKQEREKPRTGPGPVMRLRVQYKDGRWRVVQRVKVAEMTVPGSQELLRVRPHRRLAGFWFEVVDAQGEVLYRHGLRPPVPGVARASRVASRATPLTCWCRTCHVSKTCGCFTRGRRYPA